MLPHPRKADVSEISKIESDTVHTCRTSILPQAKDPRLTDKRRSSGTSLWRAFGPPLNVTTPDVVPMRASETPFDTSCRYFSGLIFIRKQPGEGEDVGEQENSHKLRSYVSFRATAISVPRTPRRFIILC